MFLVRGKETNEKPSLGYKSLGFWRRSGPGPCGLDLPLSKSVSYNQALTTRRGGGMVDTGDLKSPGLTLVPVRIRLPVSGK